MEEKQSVVVFWVFLLRCLLCCGFVCALWDGSIRAKAPGWFPVLLFFKAGSFSASLPEPQFSPWPSLRLTLCGIRWEGAAPLKRLSSCFPLTLARYLKVPGI